MTEMREMSRNNILRLRILLKLKLIYSFACKYALQLETRKTNGMEHQLRFACVHFCRVRIIDVWEGASGASLDAPRFGLKSNSVSNARKKIRRSTQKIEDFTRI